MDILSIKSTEIKHDYIANPRPTDPVLYLHERYHIYWRQNFNTQMSIHWDNKQALSPSPPTVVEKDNEMGHVLR